MEEKIRQLEERIKKLEQDKLQVIMTHNADVNAYRAVQRALVNNSLAIGSSGVPVNTICGLLTLTSITQGLVLSRMTTAQKNLISNPIPGLVIYDTTLDSINVYTSLGWTELVTTTGIQTLTNKTLITPTIADFTNAQHNHENPAGGGQLNATNIFSTGLVPTARLGTGTANSGNHLRGDQTWN